MDDPDQLRKMLIQRSLTPLGGALAQTGIDAIVAFGGGLGGWDARMSLRFRAADGRLVRDQHLCGPWCLVRFCLDACSTSVLVVAVLGGGPRPAPMQLRY